MTDLMLVVRDSALVRFAETPTIMERQRSLQMLVMDALIAWYRGDAQAAVQLYDEARDRASIQRPALMIAPVQEALALIETGRARDALGLAKTLERVSLGGNRLDPGAWQAAQYLAGRAHEALGEHSDAIERYESLLEVAGDGVRDVTFFRDTPDRLASLRAGGSGATS